MKEDQDYIKDITEMRSMMERSSRFLSLSGVASLLVGIYALAGAAIVYWVYDFNPRFFMEWDRGGIPDYRPVYLVGAGVLVLSLATAILLSWRHARKRRENNWNRTSRLLLLYMAVPLIAGGLILLVLIREGIVGWLAPFSLVFYGLAQFNAGKFAFDELKSLGLIQIALGLVGAFMIEYGLLCWAIGFGLVHIIYGIYLYNRYER